MAARLAHHRSTISAAPEPRPKRQSSLSRILHRILDLGPTIGITVLIVVGINAFVGQTFLVEQTNMQHTLEPGQVILVEKLGTFLAPYHIDDIVVFRPPAGITEAIPGTPFVKRIVAVGGQTVTLLAGGSARRLGTPRLRRARRSRPTDAEGRTATMRPDRHGAMVAVDRTTVRSLTQERWPIVLGRGRTCGGWSTARRTARLRGTRSPGAAPRSSGRLVRSSPPR